MATLKIYSNNNKTESVNFNTTWAANIKAQDWMSHDKRIEKIVMTENGLHHTTYIRKG